MYDYAGFYMKRELNYGMAFSGGSGWGLVGNPTGGAGGEYTE